jgi:hypothetical protein
MPLPKGDQPWPPIDPVVADALADWDAWYSGNPDRLADRYQNRPVKGVQNRPSQYRGGIQGRLARWWWGQPTPFGEKRTKLHVPLAGDIARTSADLLFSEPPRLLARSEHAATQARLDELVADGLHAILLEAAEVCAALGGAYLRVVWDDKVAARPWITAVHADGAAPEFRYGRLSAVTFWTVVQADDQRVWRHLERHEKGVIWHGLYEGTPDRLGEKRNLADHTATADLVVDADGALDTGAPDHLTATYIPNVRPARGWRHCPGAVGLGQSDFQGIEGILDALDETYSSWMRDVRIARGRIIVADTLLQSNGPGQGASWQEDREIFTGLNMLSRPGDPNPIEVVQFEIRHEEHRATAAELVEVAVRQAGYSPGSFGAGDEGQAVTATEIRARHARSMSTRARKALLTGTPVGDIVEALLAVEAGPQFKLGGVEVAAPVVEFADSIQEDPKAVAETIEKLAIAQALTTDTKVRMAHPDWDNERVAQEVAGILAERKQMMADPALVDSEFPA